ncbi:putative 26S proteasome regulatory subunit [Ascosphaera aggregata]|nr:putative 26S proteasome regulatory subunit [Ascosphaera aggregata]
MNTPLLTPDGFPRTDVDVAQIRTTRANIIHLRNDYDHLMKSVETKMHEHFAEIKKKEKTKEQEKNESTLDQDTPTTTASSDTPQANLPPPFATVRSISPNSPASTAGLQPNDRIRLFGDANCLNHDNLQRLASVVAANKDRPVTVSIQREGSLELSLRLIPREDWGGRGLLGCHIVPL